jgi:hypothetical protein
MTAKVCGWGGESMWLGGWYYVAGGVVPLCKPLRYNHLGPLFSLFTLLTPSGGARAVLRDAPARGPYQKGDPCEEISPHVSFSDLFPPRGAVRSTGDFDKSRRGVLWGA